MGLNLNTKSRRCHTKRNGQGYFAEVMLQDVGDSLVQHLATTQNFKNVAQKIVQ